MRIGKKKTGIHRSKEGARVTLWIPVFFGQDHAIMEVFYADTVLYQEWRRTCDCPKKPE
jgi:hypothetical protein